MGRLRLSFLGSFRVVLDGEPLTGFRSNKVRGLLAYLAVEASRPHQRARLTGLLWPNMPERMARRNLSQTLVRLRQTIHDKEASPPFLLITRQTVQFNAQSDYELDVAEFQRFLVGGVPGGEASIGASGLASPLHLHFCAGSAVGASAGVPISLVGELEAAVGLYRGEFLAGFWLPDCVKFSDWLRFMRDHLHRQMLSTLRCLTAHFLEHKHYIQALDYAQRQLELDPWQEEAYRQLILGFALDGQRGAALAHYEKCRQLLAEKLGVEPSEATTSLYKKILNGQIRVPSLPPDHPPSPLTPLIGREPVLKELCELLKKSDYRLITLVGTGGVGKTRLALAAATTLKSDFADGVCFVPLIKLSAPSLNKQTTSVYEQLTTAVTRALEGRFGRRPGGILRRREPVASELFAYLRYKRLLLLLDNFEYLLLHSANEPKSSGTSFILDLLQHAPQVKLLVTSRERLNLLAEYLFWLRTLPVPAEASDPLVNDYSSVQLFVEFAKRAPRWKLTPDNMPAIVQICQLVTGLPLGIQLAACKVGHFTCAEIARLIQKDPNFLSTNCRNVPDRQRSLHATFEHSWALLNSKEQHMLAQLALIEGPFSRTDALNHTTGSLKDLVALVDKSLLIQLQAAQYILPHLWQHLALEKKVEHASLLVHSG
ncbi:MAG: AfsR/SARP family transcriptional regulator [Ardenticatenaceae bacterium]